MDEIFVRLFIKLADKKKIYKYALRSKEQYRKFRRDFKNLTPRQRDKLREYAKNNKNYEKLTSGLKNYVGNALEKYDSGKRLSSQEKKALNLYDTFFAYETKKERIYINDSSWLWWAEYEPQTKTVFIKMSRGTTIYPFFKVPKTKWLLLQTGRGKYMWDYFGKHYSARPQNWIRGRHS